MAKKSRPHGISAPSTEQVSMRERERESEREREIDTILIPHTLQAFESIDKATTPVNIHLPSLTKLTEVKNTEVAAGGFGRIIPTPRVAVCIKPMSIIVVVAKPYIHSQVITVTFYSWSNDLLKYAYFELIIFINYFVIYIQFIKFVI